MAVGSPDGTKLGKRNAAGTGSARPHGLECDEPSSAWIAGRAPNSTTAISAAAKKKDRTNAALYFSESLSLVGEVL